MGFADSPIIAAMLTNAQRRLEAGELADIEGPSDDEVRSEESFADGQVAVLRLEDAVKAVA